ncbi:hypothetical protein AAG906_010118 [Vitis piasezkii]
MLKLVNTFGMDEIELYIEQVPVQPRVRGQLLGNFTQLLLGQNDNVEEFEYGCGPSSAPIAMTYECRADEDEEECESQEGDDQSERAEDIQHDGDRVFEFIDEENNNVNVVSSFLALHEAMEGEQGRYVSVDGEGCDMSNNLDPEDPIEFSPFENVENIGNVVSSDWTPWGNTNIGNLGGEFMVGQVFNSKADLQHAAKLYSISAHQEYVVVSSTKNCITSFAINKYNGLHKCVNPCLNRDHQQVDSNLIAAHIQGMIKAQFTLSGAAIQASIVEKFEYQISYKKASKAKLKALINLFIFWTFHPSIEGFKHCRPVLNIDGTHLYGKYKGTLMIAMGCDGNNQGLCVISYRHPSIMATMSDVHLGWSEPYTYHRVCMRHLASNFMTRFKDKILKNLMCRAALATKIEKFNKHMNTIGRINATALSHDGGRRYGIMTTNMSEVFNSVLKGARSLPITALVQLTFFQLNSYFVVRREQGANRLASNEEYTPYVDAMIKANVVKAGSHEIVLYDHIRGQFHVKTNKSTKSSSTRGRTYRINLLEYACTCGKTLIWIPIIVYYLHNFVTYMEYRGHSSDPDPLDTSILVLQDRHRFMREWEMDSHLRPYIIRSGFYGVYRIGHITLDWGLITSLVERWRPETHTFHLPVGEMTITLQDVVVILGLRVTPPTSKIRGSAISTRWLCHQFSHPPVDLDDATLERYARAFILGLIGTTLFIDKKDTHIHLLAHLYRELCRASLDGATDIVRYGHPDFGRPPTLQPKDLEHDATDDLPAEQLDHGLQDKALLHEGLPTDPLGCRWRVPLSWAQNPSRVLTFYRDQLDAQTHDQVLWEPYMGDLVAHLPAISLVDQEIWRTMSPLICFDIVKWHRPKRVLRQFGLQQGIPPSCSIELDLHSMDRRGRHKYDWGAFHAQYITLWGSREKRIATAPPMVVVPTYYTFDHIPP